MASDGPITTPTTQIGVMCARTEPRFFRAEPWRQRFSCGRQRLVVLAAALCLGKAALCLGKAALCLGKAALCLGKAALCLGKAALNCEKLHRGRCLGLFGSICGVYSFFTKYFIAFLLSALSTPPCSLNPSLTHRFNCPNDARLCLCRFAIGGDVVPLVHDDDA
jgi:hypothetical protein